MAECAKIDEQIAVVGLADDRLPLAEKSGVSGDRLML